MPAGQGEELIALALVFVVHVIGGLMLVWALLDPEQRAGWWRRWGWGGDERPPEPQPPAGSGTRSSLPLDAAQPSRVRLREPGRAADGYPRPARRPVHPPAPQPEPVPERPRRA